MLATLAVALAFAQAPPQESLFNKLFPKPTGANGYEEFARAADLTKKLYIGTYQYWLPPERRPKPEPETEKSKEVKELEEALAAEWRDPKQEALKARLDGMSALQVKIEEAQVGAPILHLIRTGLTKPIAKPQREESVIGMPFSSFRQIGALAADTAHVQFAQGRPSVAVDTLLTGMRFANAIAPYGTTDMLMSISITSRLLASFDQHLERIAVPDLQQLPNLTLSLLDRNHLADGYAKEEVWVLKSMEELAKDFLAPQKDPEEDIGDATVKALTLQIRRMTPAQKNSFVSDLKRRVRDRFVRAQADLRRPESEWIPDKDPKEEEEDPKIESLEDALDMLASWSMPARRTITIGYMRTRAQLRLLDLHSRIHAFRWTHGRLPNTLAEAGVTPKALLDPLSQEPFAYEIQSDKLYRLYSKGIPETGEIELKYTRPPTRNSNSDDP